MDANEKQAWDQEAAGIQQQRQGLSEGVLACEALAALMMYVVGGDKYKLSPADGATYLELRRRSQPSNQF